MRRCCCSRRSPTALLQLLVLLPLTTPRRGGMSVGKTAGADLIGGRAQQRAGKETMHARCHEMRQRAGKEILLPRNRDHRQPGIAFVPITHPWMGPYCITPVLQGLEQAGFQYLAPTQTMRHIGAPSPQGKNKSTPSSWRVDEADLVVQYYRTPGDRSGTAQLQHLPEAVQAMDQPVTIDGTRLIWGVPNATNIGGHKHVTYAAMRRWVRQHGCEMDELHIMPEQFLLSEPDECEAFMTKYKTSSEKGASDVWFLKDGTKHGSRGISIHKNSSSVRAAFGACPTDGTTGAAAAAAPAAAKPPEGKKLSWEDRKNFWEGSQKAAAGSHINFGSNRAGVLVQREVPSVLVNRDDMRFGDKGGGHKIAIRAYMVIVRVDPLLVVWATNASYCKVTPGVYQSGNTDLKSQVSDSFRSTGADSDGNVDNKAGAKGEGAQGWQPLSWLAKQLGRPDLVEEVLSPQIMVLFQSLVGAASLGCQLGAFQVLGIDVALRPDWNVVEFEGNMAPGWIAEAPPGDDRCAQEPGCPWLHARNQQMVADATKLVVMAHGGIRDRESVDPRRLYDQLQEGTSFRVVPPHIVMAGHGTEPGPDLDSPFDVGRGQGAPRETFLVAYNELQRSCTSGEPLFPDPCAEYKAPWKAKAKAKAKAKGIAANDVDATSDLSDDPLDISSLIARYVSKTSATMIALVVCAAICRRPRLRRQARRCFCPSAAKAQPRRVDDFVV